MDTYGFLTDPAEKLVGRLLSGIFQDIVAERVGRRSALDRVSEALERGAEADGTQPEQSVLDAVAQRLSGPFAEAGMLATDGAEIRTRWDAWSRGGAASGPQAWAPAAAARAAAHAAAASDAFEGLAESGVSVAISQVSPTDEGFCDRDGRLPARVVVYPDDGTYLPGTAIGLIVEACDGACLVEHLPADADGIAMAIGRNEILPGLGEAAIPGAAVSLSRARAAIAGHRMSVSMAKSPARLGLSLTQSRGVPSASATWDGEVVRAVPSKPQATQRPTQANKRAAGATAAVRAVAHAFMPATEETAADPAPSSGMTI